jgi:hypothetical protein
MSKIEVNQVDPQSGTTLTLGTSGDTISIPAGVTLANSGTATGFASIAWQSTIVTGITLSAVAGNGYWIDTTSNACTVTLPASANVGDQIIFVDYARTWNTNNVTIDQNSLNFQGYSTPNPVYDTNGQTVNIVYSGATQGWIPVSDDDVTYETDQSYSIDFLVVAAGGGGGGSRAAGGGAGGYRTSTQSVTPGTTITVTVGNGGAGGTGTSGNATRGTSGSDSSVSGTGITTITSAGGGGAGTANGPGANESGISGGSGGGASDSGTAGSGNNPSVAPSQGNDGGIGGAGAPGYGAGGGGGAGAVGGNGTTTQGGAGGAGTVSSITGSSVTRAGGGGGGAYDNYPGGAGGTGGGGAGTGVTNGTGSAGTANTGGGGGGANNQGSGGTGGAGGSGVVILSMPDAKYSGTTTGSPTVATGVSGKTVLTFTGSGSYTG